MGYAKHENSGARKLENLRNPDSITFSAHDGKRLHRGGKGKPVVWRAHFFIDKKRPVPLMVPYMVERE